MVLLKVIAGLLCEFATFFLFYHMHMGERAAIIEAGYRSNSKLYKPDPKHLPLWNRLLYWNLCKQSKRNPAAVWFYFACNLIVCLGWCVSVIVCIISICTMDVRDMLLYQLRYVIGAVLIWGIMHFIPDLFFLPSEQKRYRSSKQIKKK